MHLKKLISGLKRNFVKISFKGLQHCVILKSIVPQFDIAEIRYLLS